MFWHDLKYSLKVLFRDRFLIFWTFAFPLIMATLFYFAFSGIQEGESLKVIPVGMVEGSSYVEQGLQTALEQLSNPEGDERLFELTVGAEDVLMTKLEEGELDGVLKFEDGKLKLIFLKNGVNQTIFKFAVEEIMGAQRAPGAGMESGATKIVRERAGGKLDYVMIEYYTLVAMTCLYGGLLGMVAVNQKLANMSEVGKRVAVAPTRKVVMVLSSMLAGYMAQLVGLVLLFGYTVFVLSVDYGGHVGLAILLSLIGSLAGTALGVCITVLLKANENTKVGIVIAVTMLGCFLAGMMGVTTKYVIDKNIPVLNWLNPANMITDGFYALYYYDSLTRFWADAGNLVIFTIVLLMIASLALRKQRYDNL